MASPDTESECTDTESERGSDDQDASAEIMKLDEFKSELIEINRRFEVLAFHFEYKKAEHKHIVALKDEKIEKLEQELERKAQTTPEMNNDIQILKSSIFQLNETVEKLEKEKATLFSASKSKDVEIKNMRDRLSQVHKELHATKQRLIAKTEEVLSHKEDKDKLERQLDENSRLMAENVKVLKKMQEQMKLDRTSAKREMRQMEDRIVKQIEDVRENRDSSPPKAGKTLQEIKLDSGHVFGPGNRGTSTNRQRSTVKFPPLSDRTTPR
ncbi:protein Hook homolog 1-like [Dreissena polymorpha]|uniref:Uncharacterized protein n=1 Tax=Dreissena polymorpha TaxID=45954 RepID=A0A9D4RVD0_DREPO|nr:protein Hook homolog 1-like [Dreissena polymorpha]KAH3882901.1 hypothetical protein DPMN_006847 [Dreissena polymorpha]